MLLHGVGGPGLRGLCTTAGSRLANLAQLVDSDMQAVPAPDATSKEAVGT